MRYDMPEYQGDPERRRTDRDRIMTKREQDAQRELVYEPIRRANRPSRWTPEEEQ